MYHSLKQHNTLRLDSACHWVRELVDTEKVSACFEEDAADKVAPLILGYGSNVVLPARYPGGVVLNRVSGIEVLSETDEHVLVSVGAGEVWHDFVVYALRQDWYGLENLALIPGSVGAVPVQNVGAYGVEVSDFIEFCDVYCRKSKSLLRLSAAQCDFGYRSSAFKRQNKHQFVILHVGFRLLKVPKMCLTYPRLRLYLQDRGWEQDCTPRHVFDAVVAIRESRLPCVQRVGTVGSFFMNPVISKQQYAALAQRLPFALDVYALPDGKVKLFAGNLLRLSGWLGMRVGGFFLDATNPIVLCHDGGGEFAVLTRLVADIQCSVRRIFGVELVVEPECVDVYLDEICE